MHISALRFPFHEIQLKFTWRTKNICFLEFCAVSRGVMKLWISLQSFTFAAFLPLLRRLPTHAANDFLQREPS